MKHYNGIREMYILSKIYDKHPEYKNIYSILFLSHLIIIILLIFNLLRFFTEYSVKDIMEVLVLFVLFKCLYVIRKNVACKC